MRLLKTFVAAALCLAACSSEHDVASGLAPAAPLTSKAVASSSPPPVAKKETLAPKATATHHQVTDLGNAYVDHGLFTVGTGSGKITIVVGSSMRAFERTYAETGVVGVESSADPNVKLTMAPMTTGTSSMTAQQFAKIVQSRGATAVKPLQIGSLGNVGAVGVDAKTASGHFSRMYLLRLDDKAWRLTASAPTHGALTGLVKLAESLSFTGPQTSGGSDIVAGVGGQGRSNPQSASGEAQQESLSAVSKDGKLKEIVKGGRGTLQTASGGLSFAMTPKMTLAKQDDKNAIGWELGGALLLFEVTDESDYRAGEDLAEEAESDDEEGTSDYLGATTIAGHSAVAAKATTDSGDVRYLYVVDVNGVYLKVLLEGDRRSRSGFNILYSTLRNAKSSG